MAASRCAPSGRRNPAKRVGKDPEIFPGGVSFRKPPVACKIGPRQRAGVPAPGRHGQRECTPERILQQTFRLQFQPFHIVPQNFPGVYRNGRKAAAQGAPDSP